MPVDHHTDSQMQIGYCTNVHAGVSLEQVKKNLASHASEVRKQTASDRSLPVGLWLSDQASRELDSETLKHWQSWLAEKELLPFTINGFPFSDFHQDVVKQDVYLPTWAEKPRLDFTVRLAKILDAILPAGQVGSISTLPLGWPIHPKDRSQTSLLNALHPDDHAMVIRTAKHLKQLAIELGRIHQQTGRIVKVCLEPEPGCILDTAADVAWFFQEMLFDDTSTRSLVQQHLGVCHDVCHSAVMFEPQQEAIQTYHQAGIDIGKIQVSSAVELPYDSDAAMAELQAFDEPRYLHQTVVAGKLQNHFYEDLSLAMSNRDVHRGVDGAWRVHFHVPIFLADLGHLATTQNEIRRCMDAIKGLPSESRPTHFEIETYAWNVLPAKYGQPSLSMGIAKEIEWFKQLVASAL